MKEDLINIFEHFGAENQRNKLCEEFRELQDELFYIYDFGDDRENLLNEGVDTISLILQFLFDYGYGEKEIIDTLLERIKRTKQRIEDNYYNKDKIYQDRISKAIHRIQLLQMDGEVEIKDLGLIARDLKGDSNDN